MRRPLTRDLVIDTAVRLADTGGIAALTMRKLAAELEVEAMSLYHHVANKDAILDGIGDHVAGEIDLSDAGDWKSTTWRRAISARGSLLRHPWAGMLWVSRLNVGPARKRYMDVALRTFREGGLDENLTHHAYHVVENHILGYALQQISFAADAGDLATLGERFLAELPPDEFPDLVRHVRQHTDESMPEEESEFEFGLRLILDGIERIHHSMSV